ncbi:hypothetical protein GCM10007852_18270 [Agaribacter marinus]|uniref:Uncharacterized protein n=1 Tax=Agaribacter marinus TaxID=1431249 RepID=A0AA37SYI2_9ALTE|nr:hypothetical protein GCM10007852_18270 [Agaribacter marinus]
MQFAFGVVDRRQKNKSKNTDNKAFRQLVYSGKWEHLFDQEPILEKQRMENLQ